MQNPKEIISQKLQEWLDEKQIAAKFEVSIVGNPEHGDIATNIALTASKPLGKNPREVAEEIVGFLRENEEVNQVIDKIEVAGPGFINFFLSTKYLSETLQEITRKGEAFGRMKKENPQNVIVEFGDPNPFKEIHIGHLRNFCIGESFAKLLETQGALVTRANYQGDVGMHVAKAMWGLLKREEQFLDSSLGLSEKVKLLAESYVEGAGEFEANEVAQNDIREINKKIYGDDESLHALWEEGRKTSLEHFEELYSRIDINYQKYYFESITAKKGKEVVESHIDDGIFEKDDGAVIYRGENDGLHTRVFLTREGYATYEAKDLALAMIKNEEENYGQSVILTGNEQLEYFQVMLSALNKIAPDLANKTRHLTFGHVRLKDGKMSSRTGDVITATWLLDEAVKRVQEAFPEMDSATAEKVGVGAVKYSMLKFSIPADIHFSFDESITLEGNSGPYLQYTYVRTQSVIQKAEENRQKTEGLNSLEIGNLKLEIEENELLRFLTQYPYVLEAATNEYAPNLLCNYLFELSQKFNHFYQKHKIIGSEQEMFRLNLTKAVGQVLHNGLHILGIETVERM